MSHCSYLIAMKLKILVFFLSVVRGHIASEKKIGHCELRCALINHFAQPKVKHINFIYKFLYEKVQDNNNNNNFVLVLSVAKSSVTSCLI